MAFNNFTLDNAAERLGITITNDANLFDGVAEIQPTAWLSDLWQMKPNIPFTTDSARMTFLIAPVIAEVCRALDQQILIYTGYNFSFDPHLKLTGATDFVLGIENKPIRISAPIIMIKQAQPDRLDKELGNCMAQAVAAQLSNERNNYKIATVYGAVTCGFHWKFFALSGQNLSVAPKEWNAEKDTAKIIGIISHMIKPYLQ